MLTRVLVSLLCVYTLGLGAAVAQDATASAPDYVVGAQDVLKILVFDEASLSGTFRVDNDGSIQYPLIGRIRAAGLSLRELEQSLTKQLEGGFIRKAQVAIQVEQFRSRSIFVIGEVRSPGKYPLTNQMTMIEALAAAGSTTQNAGGDVLILKQSRPGVSDGPASPDAADSSRAQRVSLADLQAGKMSLNVALSEGDTVFVPRAEKFFVTGHVRTPGAYVHERDLTVLQAIALAGGITEKGSNRRIKVVRIVAGKKVEKSIGLSDVIQPGDTLVIAQRLL